MVFPRKKMKFNNRNLLYIFVALVALLAVVPATKVANVFIARMQIPEPGTVVIPVTAPPGPSENNLQLHTFPFVTLTPAPTATPTQIPPTGSSSGPSVSTAPGAIPVTTPKIGGPTAGYYCIDDVDPDMCDDNSSFLVPYGDGGALGRCGQVIEQAHKLTAALPQVMKGMRDSLERQVASACASTGPYAAGQYISTYFAIDAHNLAGFAELSKNNPSQVSPSGLLSWFQSQPAGYKFIPNSPTVLQQFASGQVNLTGCVMFLQTSSSYHVGVVNSLEVFSSGGDGVISILQSGSRMYIDRFPVTGWSVQNTSTNQTVTNGVTGYGCHV